MPSEFAPASPQPGAVLKPAIDSKVVSNATCTFCGCLCDDIELTVESSRITKAKNACALGEGWFFSQHIEDRPEATIEGRPVGYDEAVETAADILLSGRYPVTYGLSDTTCEAQRVAVAISDWIGGSIDTTTSACHGPSVMALQDVGEVTCSLGEIKNRADFLIFWGADPAETHPRLLTKYTLMSAGEFVPNGRKDRTAVLIDVRETESTKDADYFLRIKPGSDFELAWALRALAKDLLIDPSIEETTGIPLAMLEEIMRGMKQARFGAILFGRGLTMTRGTRLNSEAVLALARDMNRHTRWVVLPLCGQGNANGADNVVSWTTGYPFGVNLSRGYPRFNPGEWTAEDLLARGEADAALIVGSDPMSKFSQPAREHLKRTKSVVLAPKLTETAKVATVAFTTSVYGINTAGTVYRMDDVPIPLRPAFDSPFKSDLEILKAIENRIRQRQLA